MPRLARSVLPHIAALAAALVAASLALADEPASGDADDAAKLARRIDALLSVQWQQENVQPAPLADDAEFMRRTWLNIAGRIPPVSEVRRFLEDDSPHKRRQLVEELLESPVYISHLTNTFRGLLIPEADAESQRLGLIPTFETWLRNKLIANAGYDEIVRDLLTAPVNADATGPVAFYRTKDFKPENLGAAAARLFLGIRLECAQCHDHPFAEWQQEEFWSFAAFFAGITGDGEGRAADIANRRELTIPETDRVVQARFLDGEPSAAHSAELPRDALARWLTSPSNPYFAQATANRLWAHFFGVGIVDPVDDFDPANPPSHPQLLQEMAREFAAHRYDLKYLIRAITTSQAYQRTSRQTHPSQQNPRLFARMAVKGLTPQQVFDSLAQATGYSERMERPQQVIDNTSVRSQIQELFANENADPIEMQTSILQALALMNGSFVADATTPAQSSTLAAVIDAPFLDTAGRIETIYLAALSRKPRPSELNRMIMYVEAAETDPSRRPKAGSTPQDLLAGRHSLQALFDPQAEALGDVFWALLNSSEFILNH